MNFSENHLVLATVAMVAYSAFVPLVSKATRTAPSPPTVLVVVSGTLTLTAIGFAGVNRGLAPELFLAGGMEFALGAGVAVAVAIPAYFLALSVGPASVVVPIFGLFIAGGSLLSVAFLGESFTPRKAVGLALALSGVLLIATE